MTMRKQYNNVKRVMNLQRIIAWICSSPRLCGALYLVSGYCLAVWPATLLFWFTPTALIA